MMPTGWEKFFGVSDDDGGQATLVERIFYDNGTNVESDISLTAYADGEEDGITYIIMLRDKLYDDFPILRIVEFEDLNDFYELADSFKAAQHTGNWPAMTGYSLGTVVLQSTAHYYGKQETISRFNQCDVHPATYFRLPEELSVYHVN